MADPAAQSTPVYPVAAYSEEIAPPEIGARYVIEVFWFRNLDTWGWHVLRLYGDQKLKIAENGYGGSDIEACKAQAQEALRLFRSVVKEEPVHV